MNQDLALTSFPFSLETIYEPTTFLIVIWIRYPLDQNNTQTQEMCLILMKKCDWVGNQNIQMKSIN